MGVAEAGVKPCVRQHESCAVAVCAAGEGGQTLTNALCVEQRVPWSVTQSSGQLLRPRNRG